VSDPVDNPHGISRRSLMYWLGLLLLANALLVGLTVVSVRAQPSDTTRFLAPPLDCADPCWQGIQPGITRITSAPNLLRQSGITFRPSTIGAMGTIPVQTPRGWLDLHLNSGFGGFKADNTIATICLAESGDSPGALLLGEVLAALGTPDEVRLRPPSGTTVRVLIRFRSRQIEVAVVLPIRGARLSPLTPVDILCFLPTRMFAYTEQESSDLKLTWRGTASLLQYIDDPLFN
jgi:hypothetical protein